MKRTIWVTALLSVGCWLTACQKTLDVKPLTAEIQTTLERQGALKLKQVICPQNISMQANQSFNCVGQLNSDQLFAIAVRQVDAQGKLEWQVPLSRVILDVVQLEQAFQQGLRERKIETKVNCGDRYRLNRPNDTFECQFEQQGKPSTILVQIDVSGNITWQEILPVAAQPAAKTTQSGGATVAAEPPTKGAAVNTPPAELLEELAADQRGDD